MSKIGLIIGREYGTRVKKKSFLLMTILVPVLVIVALFGIIYLGIPEQRDLRVLVIDDSTLGFSQHLCAKQDQFNKGALYDESKSQFSDPDADKKTKHKFYECPDSIAYLDAIEKMKVEDHFDVALYFPSNFESSKTIVISYKEPLTSSEERSLTSRVNNSIEKTRLLNSTKFTESDYYEIKSGAKFRIRDVYKDKEENVSYKATIGLVFGVMIYFFIFIYGIQVMRGVMEEKTNRIVEVIVSSVKPFELMMGKIVGIMLVGLTQLGIWVLLITAFSITVIPSILPDKMSAAYQAEGNSSNVQMTQEVQNYAGFEDPSMVLQDNDIMMALVETPWLSIVFVFAFFFIFGYLLYAAMMAAVGAAVDSETDTQQFLLPVTLPLTFGYIIAVIGIENPNSAIINWCSEIPFTSPIVMLVRYTSTSGEGMLWPLLLSMLLLIVTFVFMTWVAAKIYRVGILMYGKKPSYKEIWKWLKY